MNDKNMPEFLALIERYETVTLEEIKENWFNQRSPDGRNPAEALTGFGSSGTCTLCRAVGHACCECVYVRLWGCCNDDNEPTYEAIREASTPERLLKAFRERAVHMRTLLNEE